MSSQELPASLENPKSGHVERGWGLRGGASVGTGET